jgi:hypothetical protein
MVFIRVLYTVLALFLGAYIRMLTDQAAAARGLEVIGGLLLFVSIVGLFLYDSIVTYPNNW